MSTQILERMEITTMGKAKKVHVNLVFENDDFTALEKLRHHLGTIYYKDAVKEAVRKAAETIK